jgi:hypothetical protein
MNATARTRMVLMGHRQIVTQNATGMQRKYVVELMPILFIRHGILAVKILFVLFFNKCSHLLIKKKYFSSI